MVEQVAGSLGSHGLNDTALSSTGAGVIVEIILTFVLVFTVFAVAIDPRGPAVLAPIAIGFAVLIDHFVGVPLTGASMNPARSFGPALISNTWEDHWVFWVGPLAGAALAGLIYYFVYLNDREEDDALAVDGFTGTNRVAAGFYNPPLHHCATATLATPTAACLTSRPQ